MHTFLVRRFTILDHIVHARRSLEPLSSKHVLKFPRIPINETYEIAPQNRHMLEISCCFSDESEHLDAFITREFTISPNGECIYEPNLIA